MDNIAFRSATELATLIRTRKISSVEMLQHFLGRVEKYNPVLNAIIAMQPEAAMARATAADAALAKDQSWGPLHGVPITIKDALDVIGMPSTGGAPELRNRHATENAPAVQHLIDAGAIVFGKTNLPVYSGDLQTYNEHYGTTNNPWNLARTPGGSSGGAAVAVATGLTSFELGTDIGGSIRIPAHFCGVYGHKPSWGLVPHRGYITSPSGSITETDISVVGPLARSPEDLQLTLGILAASDPMFGRSRRAILPEAAAQPLKGLRIAAWFDDPACPADAATRDRLQSLIDALAKAGAIVNDKARPGMDTRSAFAIFIQLLLGEISAGFPEPVLARFREAAAGADPDDTNIAVRWATGATQSHRQWLAANEARNHLRARWADLFKDHDVLLCPVTPTPAFPHDHNPDFMARRAMIDERPIPYIEQIFWTGIVGMAYLPSTSTPIGRSPAGLPIGVQIVGPYYGDLTTIKVAGLLREVTEGFVPPPAYA